MDTENAIDTLKVPTLSDGNPGAGIAVVVHQYLRRAESYDAYAIRRMCCAGPLPWPGRGAAFWMSMVHADASDGCGVGKLEPGSVAAEEVRDVIEPGLSKNTGGHGRSVPTGADHHGWRVWVDFIEPIG